MEINKVSEVNARVMMRTDIDYNSKIPLLWRTKDGSLRQSGYVVTIGNSSYFAKTKKELLNKYQ